MNNMNEAIPILVGAIGSVVAIFIFTIRYYMRALTEETEKTEEQTRKRRNEEDAHSRTKIKLAEAQAKVLTLQAEIVGKDEVINTQKSQNEGLLIQINRTYESFGKRITQLEAELKGSQSAYDEVNAQLDLIQKELSRVKNESTKVIKENKELHETLRLRDIRVTQIRNELSERDKLIEEKDKIISEYEMDINKRLNDVEQRTDIINHRIDDIDTKLNAVLNALETLTAASTQPTENGADASSEPATTQSKDSAKSAGKESTDVKPDS